MISLVRRIAWVSEKTPTLAHNQHLLKGEIFKLLELAAHFGVIILVITVFHTSTSHDY